MVFIKITFLNSSVVVPRLQKRITAAVTAGHRVSYIGIKRIKSVRENIVIPQVKYCIKEMNLPGFDTEDGAKPLKIVMRSLCVLRFLAYALRRINTEKPDLLYVSAFDSLIAAYLYKLTHKKVKIFCEIADTPRSKIFYGIERKLMKAVDKLVITSEAFYEKHYKKFISKEKVFYLPNMPDLSAFALYRKKNGGDFTAGFIGSVRFYEQCALIADAGVKAGVNILFAGKGNIEIYDKLVSYCKGMPNVKFTGAYDYDKEIANLYGMVDCTLSVYPTNNPNYIIAMPNRFYESVYAGVPLIVSKGTYLESEVNKYGVGIAADCNNIDELAEAMLKLKNDKELYDGLVSNCQKHKSEMDGAVYLRQLIELFEGE